MQRQLTLLETTSEIWSEEQTELLIELAQVRQSIGDTRQARELYERALYNMRINEGVYSLEQLPIILDLMTWYMAEDDEFTDQLGDRALFLYEKVYASDEQIMKLVDGYKQLITLRLGAHFSRDRRRSIHLTKAAELSSRAKLLVEKLVYTVDPEIRDSILREPVFYTRYDDLGQAISSPEGGMDQVSSSTGLVLEEVHGLLRPNDTAMQADYPRAKQLLDKLEGQFDELEHIDQAALLDFYADYYLEQGNFAKAIESYERILRIRVLRPDYQLRSLRALGQLYEQDKDWNAAIDSYNCWRQLSTVEDERVFIGLANAHRESEHSELAIYHLTKHIEERELNDANADESIYTILKQMYYDNDDFISGDEVSRKISTLFR
ncbi:MAG: hypothetical protein DHS20C12_09360 [Pseudohongiella sp.]|nr:MAG: hypothetical protein DHS20C12_09360 [Pseudohongiella sp.]